MLKSLFNYLKLNNLKLIKNMFVPLYDKPLISTNKTIGAKDSSS